MFSVKYYYLAVAGGASTPNVGLAAAKRIVEARKNIGIQCMAGLEQVIGVSLTRRLETRCRVRG